MDAPVAPDAKTEAAPTPAPSAAKDAPKAESPAAPASEPKKAAPKPASPKTAPKPGLSNEDALLAAYLVQKNKSAKQLQAVQTSTVNQVTKIKKKQKLVHKAIIYVVIFLLFSVLRKLRAVKFKYEPYIAQLKTFKAQDATGTYDFGDPFRIAWGCEYPNFTQLLFSKVANPQYPRAIILAIATQEIIDKLTELPVGDAAKYLFKMKDAAADVNLSAWDIICKGLQDLQFYTCSYECMPADRYDALDAVADIVYPAMGAAMGADMYLGAKGLSVATKTGAITMAVVTGVGMIMGATMAGVNYSNTMAQCELLTDCVHVANTGC